jgi:hypothetical protein
MTIMKIKKLVEVTLSKEDVDRILADHICKALSIQIDGTSSGFVFHYGFDTVKRSSLEGEGETVLTIEGAVEYETVLKSITMRLEGDK